MNSCLRTKSAIGLALTLAVGGSCTSAALAQWTVTSLHPPGALYSSATGVDGPRVVGSVFTQESGGRPTLWTLPSTVPTNLLPAGIFGGEVAAAGGGQQVGYLDRNETIPRRDRPRAVLWTGTAESYVDLTSPVGTAGTRAYGVGGGQQVGISRFGILSSSPQIFASLWSGTSESFVNLHDAALMSGSIAYATDGTQQGGLFLKPLNDPSPGVTRAALWTGSAASFVNLHPAGATDSKVVAVSGGQQVGNVWPEDSGAIYASLWSGTAASWVNLNPAGAGGSDAVGVSGGMQVGSASFDDGTGMGTAFVYASLWSGTAESWVNLSSFLPSGYGHAMPTGIWTDGNTTIISGYAANLNRGGYSEAIVWTRTLCPGTCCDSVDFNQNGLFPEDDDVIDFLAVFAGGACSTSTCNDIDFNNDGLFPDDNDVVSFLTVLAGGSC